MQTDRELFLDWVVYQIYPRSFYDSDGDGIGDLNGITQKIGHLSCLGVNAVWLCPCYKSPNADNGYDISDYRDIMDDFGTFADWKRLISALHERGIKLIMDLVANHTSSRHAWFENARSSRDNPYHDYYIWADKPLNDWKSVFGGSAWEYNPQTDEYYLHSFAVEQPDLNWENPKVRREICDVVDFWVERGVDGFRCDVLDYIAKDFEKGKMHSGAKLHEYIRELFGRDNVKHLFTIGECTSDEKDICNICGKDRNELTTVFQFDHITPYKGFNKYLPRPFSCDGIKNILIKWQNFSLNHDLLYTLFTDNHDYPFYLSRFGNDKELRYESATMFAAMFYLLRGIPFIYQGQEFGTANSYFEDIGEFNDVETLNFYAENRKKMPKKKLMGAVNVGSRDNPRRPLAWSSDEKTNYGFSSGKPWLCVASRADEINLEKDYQSKKSIFAFYKKLFAFRKENGVLRRGKFIDWTKGKKGYFLYERRLKQESVVIVCNFDKNKKINLPDFVKTGEYEYVLGNYKDKRKLGEKFRPYEVEIYKKISVFDIKNG